MVAGGLQAQNGRVKKLIQDGMGGDAGRVVEAVADEVGRLGAQIAGGDVGAIVQLFDGGPDAVTRVGRNIAAGGIVENERYRRL